jgi:hypothetical protein
MQLSDFLADDQNPHTQAGNPCVVSNALYKTRQNFNCYLTPTQAIELARQLLAKAQIILDHGIEDTAVQVWNQGEHSERIYLGLTKARKGGRRKPKSPKPVAASVAPAPVQHCPVCSEEVDPNPRYPRYVCEECAAQASSADGRLLEFYNVDMSGGYRAQYADTGAEYPSHECFIAGVKCHADEARSGVS